ncbi:hypothetical protein IE53DRAFT_386539 [Violaceomyces palustris]|uniref:Uncharacterized protein n=1 Tax=Violaceomyces palustris TaxID=1673888 RepID=A0ACD0NZB0_9BASI|nr:hypothetical protein IE53DRAFT_386539 [Violaceomyces palustris]
MLLSLLLLLFIRPVRARCSQKNKKKEGSPKPPKFPAKRLLPPSTTLTSHHPVALTLKVGSSQSGIGQVRLVDRSVGSRLDVGKAVTSLPSPSTFP